MGFLAEFRASVALQPLVSEALEEYKQWREKGSVRSLNCAIRAYQHLVASEQWGKAKLPDEHARALLRCGWLLTIRGDRKRNINDAMAGYEMMLKSRDTRPDPEDAAAACIDIGSALEVLYGIDESVKYIEAAVRSYSDVLSHRTRSRNHAVAALARAEARHECYFRTANENDLALAIEDAERAVDDPELDDAERARALMVLADSYVDLSDRANKRNRKKFLGRAVSYYDDALQVAPEASSDIDRMWENRSVALHRRQELSGSLSDVRSEVESLQRALASIQ